MQAYFSELAAQFQNPVTAIGQIIGFIPMILAYFVFHYNNRTTSICIKAVSDGISAVHFLLLGQPTGFAINCVNTLRGICFSQKGRHAWASGIWMPILFCCFTTFSSLLGWTGWESLLPLFGSCLAVIGYWNADPHRLRLFNLAGISLWVIYGVITMSISTVIHNCIAIVSIVRTEWSLAAQKNHQ